MKGSLGNIDEQLRFWSSTTYCRSVCIPEAFMILQAKVLIDQDGSDGKPEVRMKTGNGSQVKIKTEWNQKKVSVGLFNHFTVEFFFY